MLTNTTSENEAGIISELTEAIYRHYTGIWPDLQNQLGDSAAEMAPKIENIIDLSKVVDIEALVFPIVTERGERRFGFIGECSWDPERGFGIEMGYRIGGQDRLM